MQALVIFSRETVFHCMEITYKFLLNFGTKFLVGAEYITFPFCTLKLFIV